jgi:hypothetical protein
MDALLLCAVAMGAKSSALYSTVVQSSVVEQKFRKQSINRFKGTPAQADRKKSTASGFFGDQPTVTDFVQLQRFTA